MERNDEEVVSITMEDLLSDALQENDVNLKSALPGTEEHERLAKERDMLMKVWLEMTKQNQEFLTKEEPKWKKILDGAKVTAEIVGKILQIGGSLAIAVGVIQLGNREGFLSADEFKGLSMIERLLVKS